MPSEQRLVLILLNWHLPTDVLSFWRKGASPSLGCSATRTLIFCRSGLLPAGTFAYAEQLGCEPEH